MSTSVFPDTAPTAGRDGPRFYYGWVNLVLAAVAMTATLPGRTHGLGLITKGLTADADLQVGQGLFSVLNFWAVLLGSVLCLPIGRSIDRFGTRGVLVGVAIGLGLAVLGMSAATGVVMLFVTLTLVRGLGQQALSVVSMAMVSKWFTRRLPVAMGVYIVLLTIGFVIANFAVGEPVKAFGWRPAWAGLGVFMLVVLAPLGAAFVRSTPESMGLFVENAELEQPGLSDNDVSRGTALRSYAFWAFTLAASLFNLVWSAITLFNQSLLEARGFDEDTFLVAMAVLAGSGLPANLLGGWLAQRWPMGRLLCCAMLILGGALAVFPHLTTTMHVMCYSAALGAAGGIVTVVFFAFYGRAFGRSYLGAIQAAAQVVTVFASALGPVLLQACQHGSGSFATFFYITAGLAVALGLAAWQARSVSPAGQI